MVDFFFFFDSRRRRRRTAPLGPPRDLRFTSTASSITFLWSAPYSWGPDGGDASRRHFEYEVYDDSAARWGATAQLASTTFRHRTTRIRASGHPQGRPIADGDEVRFRVRTRNAKDETSGWVEIRGEARGSVPDNVLTWRGNPLFWRQHELTWR